MKLEINIHNVLFEIYTYYLPETFLIKSESRYIEVLPH